MTVKRILIIDDEPSIREVAQICLETVANWEVIIAASGLEGLVQAEAEQPDAILLDLMMPDMDGFTTLKKLQENPATANLPVILLTAKVQPKDQLHYKELGLKAAIAKPFEPLKLADEIAQVLGWDL
jgi:CheY-like chemotaxis protein